ncbi:hypothetical protein PoMZ_00100 [Pyricularia oryzae]|uniref:C2H2-type domain-containing protein n=1 Tax=Pyricularia oryzae TaxID=318829 RepID=A0A4P7N3H0_PYROR|nr:hypothetical protein PoMZ_00100 [Pyricularia oryzae]
MLFNKVFQLVSFLAIGAMAAPIAPANAASPEIPSLAIRSDDAGAYPSRPSEPPAHTCRSCGAHFSSSEQKSNHQFHHKHF